MSTLYKGATLRFESLLRVAIEDAARVHKSEAYGLCFVDLRGDHGQRLAQALYVAKPLGPDPAKMARMWCRSVALDALEPIVAEVLGEDMRAAVRSAHEEGSVPVVLVIDNRSMVAAFAAANEAP